MREQIFLLLLFVGSVLGRIAYNGDQVLRIHPTTEDQIKSLQILDDIYKLDFWKPPRGINIPIDVRISAQSVQRFKASLRKNRIDFEVFIDDVQGLIDSEKTAHADVMDLASFNYGVYHHFDDIQAWIDMVVTEYPKLAMKSLVGMSHEGRKFNAITISSKSGNPQFIINCGIHAREWISPATCMHSVYQLVSQYGNDTAVTSLVDHVDFVFIPSSNPDGYVYTWEDDRMWRKTRTHTTGTVCYGVDPNRNWDSNFAGEGSSTVPCSDTYCGPSPFSEPCVLAQKNFVESLPKPKMYVDVHSYSQLWMFPYGYKLDKPSNFNTLSKIANDSVAAIKNVHGKIYTAGQISTTIYVASGSTADYIYDNVTPCAFASELRDTGTYGFLLPEREIIPTAQETFAGFRVMAQAIIDGKCESRV